MGEIDALIATGSNNSLNYFEQYFGKYPHIFRKNRTSVAILDGSETTEQLELIGEAMVIMKALKKYWKLRLRQQWTEI